MIHTKFTFRLAVLTLLSMFTASTWAMPITFEFTGTISDTVLISRMEQTLFTTHSDWNGQQVSGTLTMDLPELAASPYNNPSYSQYAKSRSVYPYADWMSFYVRNPDGSVLGFSNSEPVTPAPEDEGDDAYTSLGHQYANGSRFYAQRTYNNLLTYPQKHASLSLWADGVNADWLTSNADYSDVIVKPEFANIDNYGSVYHYTDLGIGHQYYFRINSLSRIQTAVPEPGIFVLLCLGLVTVCIRRKVFLISNLMA
jgi:hypothetical protein